MKNLDEFVRENLGLFLDYDHVYGPQCVDLTKKYCVEVLGIPAFQAYGFQVFDHAPDESFLKVKNTPEGIPPRGAIVCWDGGIGENGHVAISMGGGNTNQFETLDENFPKLHPVAKVVHNYNHVIGWLIPNQPIEQVGESSVPQQPQTVEQSKPEPTGSGRTYVVQNGDSLFRIARKELGNGNRWPDIFGLNRDKIDNPDLIFPGTEIRLPQ